MRVELTLPPVLLRFRGLFFARTEMELGNGIFGTGMGIVALLPSFTLASSPALRGLLDLAPQWAWGLAWIVSGLFSFIAYLWGQRAREAALLWWAFGWLFLMAQALLTTGGISLATPLYGGLAVLSGVSRGRVRSGAGNVG